MSESTTPSPSPSPEPKSPTVDKQTPLWANPITIMGLLFVAVGILLLLTFWLFTLVSKDAQNNQYLGMIGWMMLPGVLITGLMICPVGIILRKRRVRRHERIWAITGKQGLIFLAVTFFLILPLLGVAGYNGYEFSESAEFCGAICHNMAPQYVRYQQSSHARVTCPGCHIGPGPSAFVAAKVRGVNQMVATFLDNYPRPVAPAITKLRPARETCEQCHWPSKFFGAILKHTVHFAPDESNTRHEYELLVKVGGLNNALGQAEGIHMHMLDRVEYIATDAALEKIPWIKYTYADGRSRIFRSDEKPTNAPPPTGIQRQLDCIDCHNVAGHRFESPEHSVDHALAVGQLDSTIPFIKRQAVHALSQPYTRTEDAIAGIAQDLQAYYSKTYPQIWSGRRADFDKVIEIVRGIYKTNFFPEFKVDWRTYPNHLGHMESAGCFRCHDGLHVSEDGHRISSDCQTCHTFQYHQDDPKVIMVKRFDHPAKINEAWTGLGPHENMLCTDCHDGGLGVIGSDTTIYACGDCHPSGRWLEIRKTVLARRLAATQPSSAKHE